VYVLAIGRYHLDRGSADQPPLAPALAALVDSVAPSSQLALALPASVATGFAVVWAALIARELGVTAAHRLSRLLRRRPDYGSTSGSANAR